MYDSCYGLTKLPSAVLVLAHCLPSQQRGGKELE